MSGVHRLVLSENPATQPTNDDLREEGVAGKEKED